jgi:hypothetical protein
MLHHLPNIYPPSFAPGGAPRHIIIIISSSSINRVI